MEGRASPPGREAPPGHATASARRQQDPRGMLRGAAGPGARRRSRTPSPSPPRAPRRLRTGAGRREEGGERLPAGLPPGRLKQRHSSSSSRPEQLPKQRAGIPVGSPPLGSSGHPPALPPRSARRRAPPQTRWPSPAIPPCWGKPGAGRSSSEVG